MMCFDVNPIIYHQLALRIYNFIYYAVVSIEAIYSTRRRRFLHTEKCITYYFNGGGYIYYILIHVHVAYYIGTNNFVVVLISLISKASSEIPPRIV